MSLLILNDIHLGVQRQGGTTPKTQKLLRDYLQRNFREAVEDFHLESPDAVKELVILGDLFDGFWVDPADLLGAYATLSSYLGGYDCNYLYLVAGNHDYSPKGDRLSSFEFLCTLLEGRYPDQVEVITHDRGLTHIKDSMYAIPHMPNQDLFELELAKVLEIDAGGSLLLHCNVMNNFADKHDHSLNLTEEWARKLTLKWNILVAHEHQPRTLHMGDKGVVVLGNQWPSSIADCLAKGVAQSDGRKFSHRFDHGDCFRSETWSRQASYTEMDWRELADDDGWQFIRVTGEATAAEASEVIDRIAKFRASSNAFVIGNAVKVEGMIEMDNLARVSFEEIQGFDVLSALLKELAPDEQKIVQEMMQDA